jgi:hypothetical protein
MVSNGWTLKACYLNPVCSNNRFTQQASNTLLILVNYGTLRHTRMLLSGIHHLKQLQTGFPFKNVAGMTYRDFCNHLIFIEFISICLLMAGL